MLVFRSFLLLFCTVALVVEKLLKICFCQFNLSQIAHDIKFLWFFFCLYRVFTRELHKLLYNCPFQAHNITCYAFVLPTHMTIKHILWTRIVGCCYCLFTANFRPTLAFIERVSFSFYDTFPLTRVVQQQQKKTVAPKRTHYMEKHKYQNSYYRKYCSHVIRARI